MKWSLVTNFGNPGDEWARMGVEAIIQEADPKHEFKYLRRDEGKDLEAPIETDYIVVCSMPGIWSNMQGGRENSNRFHHSWQWYRRWLSEGRKILFAGIGSCMALDATIHDEDHYLSELRLFMNRCSYYSRDSLASTLIGGDDLPCPSIFARHRHGVLPNPFRKLCNLMPSGAHEARLDKKENTSWRSIKGDVSKQLIDAGFVFVAHDPAELNHAKELGWPSGLVIQGDAKELLEIYATASVYVGNRVHGAIVARSFGAPALCIGYDTRIYAASRAGSFIINPSLVTTDCSALRHATSGILVAPHEIDHKKEFGIQLQIFNNYMKGKR